jgi:hypothetical protein
MAGGTMSSVAYLRERFSKLRTDEERNEFCCQVIELEYWSFGEQQLDSLPEGCLEGLLNNLRTTLHEEARIDLYYRFAEIVGQVCGYDPHKMQFLSASRDLSGFADFVRLVHQQRGKVAELSRTNGPPGSS